LALRGEWFLDKETLRGKIVSRHNHPTQ
jgi:hypothetical protein